MRESPGADREKSGRPSDGDGSPLVEPIPDARAATARLDDGVRALVVTDYHAGYEAALRYEVGLEIPSRAEERRNRLISLLHRSGGERLVILGDLMHSIGEPGGPERAELEVLFESLPSISVTLVKGNHDGEIQEWLPAFLDDARPDVNLDIVPGAGATIGSLGVCHGHTWPAPEVLTAEVICCGHEHPTVRLADEVGGRRIEPGWLRGRLDPTVVSESTTVSTDAVEDLIARYHGAREEPPRLVVVPAFNDLVSGTRINAADSSFLSPFLPEGILDGEAYLLDGTHLGRIESDSHT